IMTTLSFCLAVVLAAPATAEPADPAAPTTDKETSSLNEPPHDGIEIPPGRPEWIGKGADLTGKVHKISVASGPYAEDAESRRALDQALVTATNHYIAEQLGRELAPKRIQYN